MSVLRRYRNEFGLLAAIAVVLAVAAAASPSWQSQRTAEYNAKVLVRSASILGIFALGAGTVILAGGIDLSAGSVIAFSATTCAATVMFLVDKDAAGRHLYAMGGNEEAARLSGIRTDRLKWLAYCVSAVTASVAGVLLLAETGSADPSTQGLGYELNAIAASVIGGCALTGGVGTVPGILLGALFLRVVTDSVAKLATGRVSPDELEGLIVGLLVLLAVAFNELRGGGVRRAFFAGPLGTAGVGLLSLLVGAVASVLASEHKLRVGAAAAGVTLALLAAKKAAEVRASRRA